MVAREDGKMRERERAIEEEIMRGKKLAVGKLPFPTMYVKKKSCFLHENELKIYILIR